MLFYMFKNINDSFFVAGYREKPHDHLHICKKIHLRKLKNFHEKRNTTNYNNFQKAREIKILCYQFKNVAYVH